MLSLIQIAIGSDRAPIQTRGLHDCASDLAVGAGVLWGMKIQISCLGLLLLAPLAVASERAHDVLSSSPAHGRPSASSDSLTEDFSCLAQGWDLDQYGKYLAARIRREEKILFLWRWPTKLIWRSVAELEEMGVGGRKLYLIHTDYLLPFERGCCLPGGRDELAAETESNNSNIPKFLRLCDNSFNLLIEVNPQMLDVTLCGAVHSFRLRAYKALQDSCFIPMLLPPRVAGRFDQCEEFRLAFYKRVWELDDICWHVEEFVAKLTPLFDWKGRGNDTAKRKSLYGKILKVAHYLWNKTQEPALTDQDVDDAVTYALALTKDALDAALETNKNKKDSSPTSIMAPGSSCKGGLLRSLSAEAPSHGVSSLFRCFFPRTPTGSQKTP